MPRLSRFLALTLGLAVVASGPAVRAQPNADTASAGCARASATLPAGNPAPIGRPAALFLIRSVLLALHQANQTGNYTVLRDISAPDFASANTAARLADIFAPHRDKGIDLSEVAVLEPDLEPSPEITSQGHLHLAGRVRSFGHQIEFELVFSPVDGRWRLAGIATNVTPLQAEMARAKPPTLRTSTAPGPVF